MVSVGVRQFREELSTYIDAREPIEVTRHGQVVGVFVPAEARRPFDPTALLAAGARLDADLAAKGIDPEDLIAEAEEMHRARGIHA